MSIYSAADGYSHGNPPQEPDTLTWPPPIPFDSWEVGEEYDQVDDYCWEVFLEAEWEGETYVASGVTVHGDLCDIYEDTIEVKEA